MKFSYSFSTHIIANSSGTKKSLLANHISNDSKISVVGNPVLSREDINSNMFEDKLSNKDENLIICAGRLENQKNFYLAIEIIRSLNYKEKNKKFKLVIFGEGSQRSKLEEFIKENGLSDFVYMPGFSLNLLQEMKDASLFLLTSNFEGFGNVIVEALFCGLPVCAKYSDGGVKDILKNRDFVKIIKSPDNNPDDFLDGIINLLNIDLIKSKKEEIRELSLDYSIENMGKKYLDLIISL